MHRAGSTLWFLVWALLLLGAELALSPRVSVGGVSPDWLLVLAVFVALRWPAGEGLLAAWLLGLAADLLVGTRLGLLALGYLLVAAVLGQIRLGGSSRARWLARAVVLLLSCTIAHAAVALAVILAGERPAGAAVRLVGEIALYTALVGPLLCWVFSRSLRWLRLDLEAD